MNTAMSFIARVISRWREISDVQGAQSMKEPCPMLVNAEGEISLGSLLKVLIYRRRLILYAAVAGFLLGVCISIFQPIRYSAQVKLISTQDQEKPSGLSQASSLLGLNIGQKDRKFIEVISLLNSVRLANRLQEKHNIYSKIYDGIWKHENGKWVRMKGPSIIGWPKRVFLALFGIKTDMPPSAVGLANEISRTVDIKTDKETGIVTLSTSNKNPYFARDLLTWLPEDADGLLKESIIKRTSDQIGFLREQLKHAQVEDLRQGLISVLNNDLQLLTSLQSGQPYSVEIIDGPVVSEVPVSPTPVLNTIIGSLMGALIGVIIALTEASLAWRKAQK
jgi:uncharacterized protein involved in exopolysaccharide biosynthesis